ncbi:unnamed protein product [Rotaria socialis]|uniref:Uncharacterized protein n=1 Tax=Rotaria socialis TaxID=392032 RepID=A0A820B8K6_9BILA|nr:unnamed protein product [Rotaria socialis]CAF3425124.1 unnamed protein product [Rotaria socialis]CAF4197110.1 unnamed protein product [Rotaria socialis]CAF4706573.1 unnamed protein product [Rotaria socialis]
MYPYIKGTIQTVKSIPPYNMMLKILLFLFVLGLLPHQDNSLDEVEWYRNEMTTKVVPLYSTAYRILNNDIIERILHFDENPNIINIVETSTVNRNKEDEHESEDAFSSSTEDGHSSKTENIEEVVHKPDDEVEEKSKEGKEINEDNHKIEDEVDGPTEEEHHPAEIRKREDNYQQFEDDINEKTDEQSEEKQPQDELNLHSEEQITEKMMTTAKQVSEDDNTVEIPQTIEQIRVWNESVDDQFSVDEHNTQENVSDETVPGLMTTTSLNDDDDDKLGSNESEDTKSYAIVSTDETTENDTVTNAENIIESAVTEFDQVNSEQNRLRVFVSEIGIAVNSVHELLGNASSECEQLHNQTYARITTAVLDISKQEEELRQLVSTISELTSTIDSGEQQVRFAEQVVREREAAVQNAERAQRDAEHKVDRARVCQNGRRKKRLFGNWWRNNVERPIAQATNWVAKPVVQATNWVAKPVVQATNWVAKPVAQAVTWAVIKPVCSVVNMGGIDIAKGARNLAGNMLNDARHRLTIQQEELASKRTQLSNVQLQQYFKNIQQSILQTQLSKMRTNYAAISSLLNQFRNVKVHLTNVLDSSKMLTAELKSLIDFELVIVPLKTLAEQMIKDQLMPSFNFEITVNTIAAVDRVLDQLSEKLERFPLLHQNSAML